MTAFDNLTIRLDEQQWASFARTSELSGDFRDDPSSDLRGEPSNGLRGDYWRWSFPVTFGFTLDHVRDAAAATPWIVSDHGRYQIQSSIGCDRLGQIVQEMFSYFETADQPRPQLLQIGEFFRDAFLDGEEGVSLPWWGLAWLDLTVREDAADEARSASIWNGENLVIDLEKHRARRALQLKRRLLPNEARLQNSPETPSRFHRIVCNQNGMHGSPSFANSASLLGKN